MSVLHLVVEVAKILTATWVFQRWSTTVFLHFLHVLLWVLHSSEYNKMSRSKLYSTAAQQLCLKKQ